MPDIADTSHARSAVEILLTASSVAIIGASDDRQKASGRTQDYLVRYGFAGNVYPVNPHRDTVQGVPSYARVADIPEAPDVAVIVMPRDGVEQAVRDCGERGIPLAVIYASGYAELGGEGALAQESLARAARESNVRIIGPNSNGVVIAPSALTATFMTGLNQDRWTMKDDGIAFVSQSGALGAFILNLAQGEGIGVGRFIATGNEIDLSLPELIHQLVDEGSTRTILGYVEGVRDGEKLLEALHAADARDIPVALMKVGRSAKGAAAAVSHTGSLVGADTVYDGIFRRYGVQRAESIEDLLDLGRIFASPHRPDGNRLTILTMSGGAGALMTDYADELGLDVVPWQPEWRQRMAAVLPSFASTTNPVDATGAIATVPEVLDKSVKIALENPDTDVLLIALGNLENFEERVCADLIRLARDATKPILVTWVGGSGRPIVRLNSSGVPAFGDPRRTMRAASALVNYSTRRRYSPTTLTGRDDGDLAVLVAANATERYLDEVAAKQLVASVGIRTVDERAVDTAQQAVAAAQEIGYPVVAKLLSRDVAHKSELGGVKVGLAEDASVEAAVDHILGVASSEGIRDARIVVQKMMSSDTEIILGSVIDPVFGPVTMLGIGGVLAEVVADVQVRPSPVTQDEARQMIDDLRGVALLRGVRGRRPVDESELARTVAAFSRLSVRIADRVESIELNPLLVDADGAPVAVDALVVRALPGE